MIKGQPVVPRNNANPISSSPVPPLDSVWMARFLEAAAIPLAFWFKPVCVCVALFW